MEDGRRSPPSGIHSPAPVPVIRDGNKVAVVMKPPTQGQ